MKNHDGSDLSGKLLLAMPAIGDSRFHRGVIYMCSHDEKGAVGFVVNQPMKDLTFSHLIAQIGIESDIEVSLPVMQGGPVDQQRGFLLHSPEFRQDETMDVDDAFSITATTNALEEIARGRMPDQALFILGYAGWDNGQLESELQQNSWLVVDPDPSLVFDAPHEGKWEMALGQMGIDPMVLSGDAGRA